MRFLVFILCFCCGIAFGQDKKEGTLFGKVTNEDGNSIVGASIIFRGDFTHGATSDIEGNYKLKLPVGTQKLICRFTNMVTDTFVVTIKEGEFTEHNIQLKEYSEVKKLDAVKITAGKFDTPIEEVTVSLSIIKPKKIENTNTRNITSVLDRTPGLNIMDGEPQIRGGSGFTFGVGSKVAIFVDDMPMISGDAGRPLWDFIPLENIKQIEVIKGCASVLSGAGALSGAIRIHTKYPSLHPLTKINVYTGMYSYPDMKGAVWQNDHPSLIEGANFLHSRKVGNWDITFGGDFNYDQGYMGPPILDPYIAQSFPDTISNFNNKQMATKKARINFKIRHRSKKYHGLTYGLAGNGMLSHSPMVFAWLNDTSGLYRGYPGATFLNDQTMFNLDPFISLSTATGGQHKLRGRFLYTDNDITANQSNNTKLYYINYQYKKSFKNLFGLHFIGGLTYNYVDTYAEMYEGSGQPENYLEHMSGYAQLEKKFWGILNLSAGARLEYYSLNHRNQTKIKPIFRAGGNLKLTQATFLRASYGQGYRYPTITERFIQTGVGNFGVFPNPDLKPESSINTEVGVRQGFKFGNVVGFFDVAGYMQKYENTIQYMFGFWNLDAPNGLGAGFKFVNTDETRVLGIDASIQGKADIGDNNSITFMIGYNYILPKTLNPDYVYAIDEMDRKYTYNSTSLNPENDILKYRFLHNVKGDIAWHYKDKLTIGVSIKYFSKMANMDGVIAEFEHSTHVISTIQNIMYMDYFHSHNKGTWILSARANYSFNEMHKLSLVVKNFMNKVYSLRPLKIEAPRSIVLQYTLTLGGS